jgi:hypothetical protein
MVIRLQTLEGDTKEYQTVYSVRGGPDPAGDSEGSPHYLDKYITNCGLEWKDKPKEHEECNHLECAIYLAKQKRKKGPEGFMFFIVLAAVSMILAEMLMAKTWLNLTIIFLLFPAALFPILLAFYSLIRGLRAGEELLDLTEYRDKGTINGIKAWRLFDE